jgi:hypothetical protein
MKRGMALKGAHVAREEAKSNRTAAVSVIDAVDQRRQFLAPVIVGREQVRLMVVGGDQVKQHHADAERFGAWHPFPELLEAGEQEAGVARLVKIGFLPPAAEIADPRQMRA